LENEKVIEWIQRELDGDLTGPEKEQLEQILEQSPVYARLAGEYLLLSEELSRLPRVNPPVDLVKRVLALIEAEEAGFGKQKQRILRRWLISMVASLTLLTGGTAAFLAVHQEKPQHSSATHTVTENVVGTARKAQASLSSTLMESADQKTGVWSPQRRYRAAWEQGRLVVRTAEGRVQFASPAIAGVNGTPAMTWLSERKIRLIFPRASDSKESVRVVEFDVEAKRETR
jgi:hypothetical protein